MLVRGPEAPATAGLEASATSPFSCFLGRILYPMCNGGEKVPTAAFGKHAGTVMSITDTKVVTFQNRSVQVLSSSCWTLYAA